MGTAGATAAPGTGAGASLTRCRAPMTHPLVPHRLVLAVAGLVAAALLLALVPARADAFNCRASALRGNVLTAPAIEPVVVNPSTGNCGTGQAGLNVPLPPLVTAGVASARTVATGAREGETAAAAGGIADLRVVSLPDLPIPLPPIDLSPLAAVPVVSAPIPGLSGPLTVDARAAAEALLPGGRLPRANLVEVQGLFSQVNGRCAGGQPQLTGGSSVAGIRVLGQELPVNQVVEQTLSLVDTAAIDPSRIDLSRIPLPAGVTLPAIQPALQAALDAIPNIAIPPTLLNVRVTPAQQERAGDRLTQRALRVQASIAGTQVADLVFGEATITSAGTNCTPVAASAPQQELQCTTRRIVLTDVIERGGRVRITGTADRRRFAGDRVSIVFAGTGRTIARPTVRSDGTFSATAPLPARSIRRSNRARYQARIGRERSLDLKLFRRMIITGARSSGGRLTISGRVTRPLARPVRSIELQRRVSCRGGFRVVRRFRPRADGTFRVTTDSPPRGQRAVYRLETRVRKTTRNPKLFPTFTLPRFVDLGT